MAWVVEENFRAQVGQGWTKEKALTVWVGRGVAYEVPATVEGGEVGGEGVGEEVGVGGTDLFELVGDAGPHHVDVSGRGAW